MNYPIEMYVPDNNGTQEVTIKLTKQQFDSISKMIEHNGITIQTAVQMLVDHGANNRSFSGLSHYDYIDIYGKQFSDELGIDNITHMSVAHGDKAYGYKSDWLKAGISFPKGVLLYLLTYQHPYSRQVRETDKGWVDVGEWVITTYNHDAKLRAALDKLP